MAKGLFAKLSKVPASLKSLPFVDNVAETLKNAQSMAGIPLGNEKRAKLGGLFKATKNPPKSPEEIQEAYDHLVELLHEKGKSPNDLFAIGLTNKNPDAVRCHIKNGGFIDPKSDEEIIKAVRKAGIKIVERVRDGKPDGIEFQLDPNKIVEAWKKQKSKIPPDKKAEYENQTKDLEANLGIRGIKIGQPRVTTDVPIGSKARPKSL